MPITRYLFNFNVLIRSYSTNTSNSKLYSLLNTMNKTVGKRINHLQNQRKNRPATESGKYFSGKVYFQIIGSGAKGSPQSVYLFTDFGRYLFNCGEGTQRIAQEHKIKLSRLEHIFITQGVWKNIGGLPGTALTIQDVGVTRITLHGPSNLHEIFPATRRFVILRDLEITVANTNTCDTFEDEAMIVKYIPLMKNIEDEELNKNSQMSITASILNTKESRDLSTPGGNGQIIDDTDYYAYQPDRKKTIHNNSTSAKMSLSLSEQNVCFSYICRLRPRAGALNLDKCVLNGVPPGPLLGKLKLGEDVTLSNGKIVKACDVCEPDEPGPVFLVVDCPSEAYLDSLCNNKEIQKHQRFAEKDDDFAYVVLHFTPLKIANLARYKEWIDNFSPSTEHIFVNERNKCMGSTAVHRIQHKLNLLEPNIFPILGDVGTEHAEDQQNGQNSKSKPENNDAALSIAEDISTSVNYRHIATLSKYHLRPKCGFDNTSNIKINVQEYMNEVMNLEEFPEALKSLKEKLSSARLSLIGPDFPRLIFLGTGSCIPNKTRNTSGILLQINENKNIILDCGEGTYGQIVRLFGTEKCDEILRDLDAIYVSHLHADHHLGLIGLLNGRRRALNKLNITKQPLYLFAPHQIVTWLSFYDRFFESIQDQYILLPNGQFILDENSYSKTDKQKILEHLTFQDFNTCLVKHCPNSFGVAIILSDGTKIAYSGDTMPSQNFVQLGMCSDIVIHEATMEDELETEAIFKMHSTTSQAIETCRNMKAKQIILTHFSQRYSKLPRFNKNFSENVCIAFDNMILKFYEITLIPLLYSGLKIMFSEDYENMENRTLKRKRKIERQISLDKINVKKQSN